jgi:hypothetical protein
MSSKQLAQLQLWRSFSRAIDTELRDRKAITGASGMTHPVEAIAVDDKTKRVVVICAESHPRIAALIQSDIQATMPDVKVLVARPSIIDLGVLVRDFFPSERTADFTVEQAKAAFVRLQRWSEKIKRLTTTQKEALGRRVGKKVQSGQLFRALGGTISAANVFTLPALAQVVGVIQQASAFDWQSLIKALQDKSDGNVIPLSSLYKLDNAAIDRGYGICPLPLYEFGQQDWETFLAAKDVDLIRERLKSFGIFQYFYPPADQIALGVAERGIKSRSDIIEVVKSSPTIGHPLAPSELVPSGTQLTELIDALTDRGFLTDLNQSVEVSEQGLKARITIKTRPREGLLSKLITRFSLKASLTVNADSNDLLGGR